MIVKMPLSADFEKTLTWIASKQAWIEKRLKLIESMKLGENEIWYLGAKTKVTYGIETVFKRDGIVLKQGASLENTLREHSIHILNEQFKFAVAQTNLAPKTLRFRTMKRSWGRCTSKGEITLNTRLISCEPRFIHYVCIHELMHLKHLNHSPMFWQEVKKYVSDLAGIKKSMIMIQEDRLGL